MSEHFTPTAIGWVVRQTFRTDHGETHSWWYGPDHGWGTTSGPLDYSVAVFRTRREATEQASRLISPRRGFKVEKVADAVAFAIGECERRAAAALAGDRPDRHEIAAANDRTKKYLQGKRDGR